MKGIIFTEFLEMVESSFGLEVVDTIMARSELPSEGTYDFNEMLHLIGNLSTQTKIAVDGLLYTFGSYLFDSLGRACPAPTQNYTSPLGLLCSIEGHILVRIKKMYPEIPTFKILEKTNTSISMIYCSSRRLYGLAHGLIEKTFQPFHKNGDIRYELLKEDGTEVKFDIVQDGE